MKMSIYSIWQKQAEANTFIKKETLVQMFPCEFWEIYKSNLSYRTPPVAASVQSWGR